MSAAESPESQATVVIADDHPLYQSSLERLVLASTSLRLVASVTTGQEALEACRTHEPDVLMIDLHLPDRDALDVISELNELGLETNVLVFSGALDEPTAYRCLELGVSGLITKDASADALERALERVSSGKTALSEGAQELMFGEVQRRGEQDRATLSERERDILQRFANGSRLPEVASELFLSPSTVKTHLESIYRKLNSADRTTAVAEALRRGLIR